MFDALALRHAMLDANCSCRELAQACNMSKAALYRRLDGEVAFNLFQIDRCVEHLRLDPDKRDAIFFAPEVS